jgi:tetratricopeptide (TPR) repeat protein
VFENVHRYVLVAKLHSYLRDAAGAVRVLSDGIERHPSSPHLYRHRGHFRVTLRDFDGAVSDFEQAVPLLDGIDDEIEYYQRELVPEMERAILEQPLERLRAPTPIDDTTLGELRDVYKGTLKSSTWYHYGLARYLRGEYDLAADTYATTLTFCVDDDMRVATLDWRYMSLRRAGRDAEAAALLEDVDTAAMHINEPSYHRRMRMYRGELEPGDLIGASDADTRAVATQGYGVGNWYFYNGDPDRAASVFERVIGLGQREAFGHIAAEVDLARAAARG